MYIFIFYIYTNMCVCKTFIDILAHWCTYNYIHRRQCFEYTETRSKIRMDKQQKVMSLLCSCSILQQESLQEAHQGLLGKKSWSHCLTHDCYCKLDSWGQVWGWARRAWEGKGRVHITEDVNRGKQCVRLYPVMTFRLTGILAVVRSLGINFGRFLFSFVF